MPALQYKWFMVTIPKAMWVPALPNEADYCLGQGEVGADGYEHWQFIVHFPRKVTLSRAKRSLPTQSHLEPTRSEAAVAYVRKEETRIPGTEFEYGTRPINRAVRTDWDEIWGRAIVGDLLAIPSDIRVRCYGTLRRISADYASPVAMERSVIVYYGPTGTGKSRRAWSEAGLGAFAKDPRSKFWCGYQGHANVVIDEFRGGIDISHLLRWFDRYPCIVELKGSSTPLCAVKIWVTSNLHPLHWYPDLDQATYLALERRLEIINIE